MVTRKKLNDESNTAWAKFIIVSLAIIVPMVFLYMMFSGYKDLPHAAVDNRVTLADGLMQQVRTVADSNSNIIAIQVVYVDLSQNIRSLRYMYIKDPGLDTLLTEHNKNRISPFYPVFTADNTNNDRITRLINHEFVCSPYSETISAKVVPGSVAYVKTICSIAIPPSYGRFSGILAVLLKRQPTDNEISIIQSYIKHLSIDIDNEDQR